MGIDTKTELLRVRLTREEKMKLDLNAARQNMTISDYAKSGLRYQQIFGRDIADIQNKAVFEDLTVSEQENLNKVLSELRNAYMSLNELVENKKVPAWTKNMIRDYILPELDKE